jgi:RNA polymerase sigma-70 factor (ECF subfamily)
MEHQEFPETRWSLIQAARSEDRGLATWCETYLEPAKAYLLALGCGPDDADDFQQEFFHRLIKRGPQASLPEQLDGSFRAYLKRTIKNFVVDQRRAQKAARHGGGKPQADVTEINVPDESESPDLVFDKAWLVRLMEIASERLRHEFAGSDREEFFQAVAPLLDGRRGPPGLAEQFKMSEAAFRAALYQLRKRYRALIESELRETVSDPEKFEEKMRHLMAVWS